MRDDPETDLSPPQRQDLRRIAGMMIPASDEFAVPGADDAAIFDDILCSLGRDRGTVRVALAQLSKLAGGDFSQLDGASGEPVVEAFLSSGTPEVTTLGRVILQCYYRDDRVMRSLGVEPRPPFPKGHALDQGDWSLLDAVRSRPKMWRDVP
jgi:hypothetical protein